MSEIRSTIDLMMERTKGMTLSDEEKEEQQREELRKRARGLRTKLIESDIPVDEIMDALNKEPDDQRGKLEAFLWEEMIDVLPRDKAALKYLDLMERLPQSKSKSNVLDAMKSSLRASLKARSKDVKKRAAQERKKLASFGISGTAVTPKLDAEALGNSLTPEQLEGFKRELRS